MSYLARGQDVLQEVLRRGGELTTSSSRYYERTKGYVMRALADVTAFAPWPWALNPTPGILSVPAKTAHTVIAINTSNVWTLASTVTLTQAEKSLVIDADGVPYRITAHTAGTDLMTVDAAWTEGTPGTGLSLPASIIQDEFYLADPCLKVWHASFRNRAEIIDVVVGKAAYTRPSNNTLSGNYALGVIAQIAETDSAPSRFKVRLTPWLETAATIEYVYAVRPVELTWDGVVATDTPAVPPQDLHVVADRALYYLFMDKHDNRADAAFLASQNKLLDMQRHALGIVPEAPRP